MGTKNALKKQIQKTHTRCRRCGRTSFHIQKKVCSGCGYPSARLRHYNWCKKMIRRKTRGTGRMRYEKELPRKAKNGFREQVNRRSLANHQDAGYDSRRLRRSCATYACVATAHESSCTHLLTRRRPLCCPSQTQAPPRKKASA